MEMETNAGSQFYGRRLQMEDEIIYGVFASESRDSGSYKEPGSKKRLRTSLSEKKDYAKPVNFVSAGYGVPVQEIDCDSMEDSQVMDEEGSASSKNSTRVDDDDLLPYALRKKLMKGVDLHRKREKGMNKSSEACRRGLNTNFGAFGNGVVMKMLEKDGYKGGGLGKNEQGIVAPIEAKLRPKNMGLGFNDYKEVTVPALEEPDEKSLLHARLSSEDHIKEKLWSKQTSMKKMEKKKVYITAEQVLAKKQERGLEVVQKVFDMRGPEVRVLTNLANLNAENKARESDVLMPEPQHNVDC